VNRVRGIRIKRSVPGKLRHGKGGKRTPKTGGKALSKLINPFSTYQGKVKNKWGHTKRRGYIRSSLRGTGKSEKPSWSPSQNRLSREALVLESSWGKNLERAGIEKEGWSKNNHVGMSYPDQLDIWKIGDGMVFLRTERGKTWTP